MITRVVYNNKLFKMINQYSFKFSNTEVTFNDIKIDFTNCTIADIPYKYQEIKIVQAKNERDISNGKVLFVGYLDSIKLSEMKTEDEYREITLTLLSPLKLATKRYVSLIATNELSTAIRRVLQPLVDDGFTIKELNVPEGQITTNFALETVEYCMNSIGHKRNIFWFIDQNKNIYVNSIDYLFNSPIKKTINSYEKEKGLLKIQPQIENNDYSNIINFKNVRLIYDDYESEFPILPTDKIINNGDIVSFEYPIIIDKDTLQLIIDEAESDYSSVGVDALNISLGNDNGSFYKQYIINLKDGNYTFSDGISFNDGDGQEGEIVLQRDTFFKNLIIGFKWNGPTVKVFQCRSWSALRYTTMRFMYSTEINKLKGIISQTGQIEKTINFNETWTTLKQLITYARSLMIQNSNIVNQVVLKYDVDPNLKIGDIINISKPRFFVDGIFAVKDIRYTFYNETERVWEITAKNSELVSNYIDIFRPQEKQNTNNTINSVVLSEFIDEQINEIHYMEQDDNIEFEK